MLRKNVDIEKLRESLENITASEDVEKVLYDVLDNIESLDDEEEIYLSDMVYEATGEYFIYYSDAWKYLQDECITDFQDAFSCGITQLCGIATYYLEEDVFSHMPQEFSDLED